MSPAPRFAGASLTVLRFQADDGAVWHTLRIQRMNFSRRIDSSHVKKVRQGVNGYRLVALLYDEDKLLDLVHICNITCVVDNRASSTLAAVEHPSVLINSF